MLAKHCHKDSLSRQSLWHIQFPWNYFVFHVQYASFQIMAMDNKGQLNNVELTWLVEGWYWGSMWFWHSNWAGLFLWLNASKKLANKYGTICNAIWLRYILSKSLWAFSKRQGSCMHVTASYKILRSALINLVSNTYMKAFFQLRHPAVLAYYVSMLCKTANIYDQNLKNTTTNRGY